MFGTPAGGVPTPEPFDLNVLAAVVRGGDLVSIRGGDCSRRRTDLACSLRLHLCAVMTTGERLSV
jgi:hypothetical protein